MLFPQSLFITWTLESQSDKEDDLTSDTRSDSKDFDRNARCMYHMDIVGCETNIANL